MNAVVLAVVVMLALSFARVHVVISLIIGALVGGISAGMGMTATMESFTKGIANGASIALSYVMLGAFAVAIARSGMPQAFASWVIRKAGAGDSARSKGLKWGLLGAILAAAIMSQNLVPIHIAFVPLLIPPLLLVFNRFDVDRRLLACIMTFGLVTTYMYLPYGFGNVFLNDILLANIDKAGLKTDGINVMAAMGIPALGMVAGLLIAVFFSYRKPRHYEDRAIEGQGDVHLGEPVGAYRIAVALLAVLLCLVVQIWADSLLLGALVGFAVFVAARVIKWSEADAVFDSGMKMMAMIGFIMIAAQGFAQVMSDTGQVDSLVKASAEAFGGSKLMGSFVMLFVGLLVTMGIGSSFSTLPIITTIFVPLCLQLGFSPLATVSIIGTAGALGDAGSPASDSTLGPTSGLNVDGQHDHIRDTVIPTFLHYNIPLLLAGWIASMVL
ncbi:Na+/H+ antiporter NhaC family protein [Luteococcus sp. H138]|uniref:Na+/H+ antiporter family protein n=1 Tax=unclassified Luteococcus TaxID=2639923 RepID=UPI00313AF359